MLKRLALAVSFLACSAASAQTIKIGEMSVLPKDDSGNANVLIAQPATLSQGATIQSLAFYVVTASGKLRLGIYDATGPGGAPGAKKAETAELTPVVGWNTAAVVTQVDLPPATYWLCYFASSNSLHFRLGGTYGGKYVSLTYGALPATFPASASTTPDPEHWSFYATLLADVVTPVSVSVAPTSASLVAGGTKTFSATVTGSSNAAVTWSVSESNGGTISSSALYTAPATTGTFHVVATSSADSTKSATATVTVTAPLPTIQSFTVAPATITSGGSSTLTATFTNGTGSVDQGVGTIASSIEISISPAATTTYTLTVANGAGNTATATATLTVAAPLPSIQSFTASPASIASGASSTLVASYSNGTASVDQGVGAIVSGAGVNVSPAATTTYTLTVVNGSGNTATATVTVVVVLSAPTVATAASASPGSVTGTTTNLSVLGADSGGESSLTYTWAATAVPSGGSASFSVNGTNASKNTVATFNQAGSYTLQATIKDQSGLTAASSVTVTVSQTLTTLAVSPVSASIPTGGGQQFSASASDQFGVLMSSQPGFTWGASGGGTISASGLFTAGATVGGPYSVTASSGSKSGTASVTVVSASANLALNRAATASSLEASTYPASYAFDGSLTTRWSSAFSDPQWIMVDLGSTYAISHVKLTWEAAYGKSYQIQVSSDANTWTTIYQTTTGTTGVNDLTGLSGTGRYVRMYGTARGTQYGYSLWEFEVYGSVPSGSPPTVATAASASPGSVTGTTTNLSVLGADSGGESSLTYTWAATAVPSGGSASFSVNGTNASKNTVATFNQAGSYILQATIKDQSGLTAASSVTVTVSQTLTTLAVSPVSASIPTGGGQQFSASASDQFGVLMSSQPGFTWGASGGGTISASGLFTAGATVGGPYSVTASSGSKSGTASVTVVSASANLALNRAATASSLEASTYPASYAFDGSLTTRWSSAFSDPQWIMVDLGSTYAISHVKLTWEAAYGKSYQIQVSSDANTWTTIYQTTTGTTGVNDLTGLSGTGRYVRMYGTARGTQYGYSLWEFEVYGSVPSGSPPTVATAASASPGSVTGTTTNLSVLGADSGGESSLTYTWAATAVPSGGSASFSVNGTNASKNTVATFNRAGSYILQATIKDQTGLTAASSVTVTVSQTVTTLAVSPASASVQTGATQLFSATALDQFGSAMQSQPSFTWSASGGGTIDSGGLFTADGVAGGPFTITTAAGSLSGSASVTVIATSGPAYPLVASSNGRYLIDQNGTPTLLVGDGTAQTLFERSVADATTYLADRSAHGFNAIWVHFIVNNQDDGNADGATDDGIVPFTGTISSGQCDSGMCYDLSTPNPAFFARVDQILGVAASYGIVVLVDTLENDSFLQLFELNGSTKVTQWAQYLANRYSPVKNIIWLTGNDFQTWNSTATNEAVDGTFSTDNGLAEDIMAAISAVDEIHLQTTELNYNISGSLDDTLLAPYTTLAGAYTYYPAYYEVLQEYNSTTKTAPVFLEETYYEGVSYGNLAPNVATNLMLRKMPYWTVLAGGLAGYMYGSQYVAFPPGWETGIDSLAVTQFEYWKALFTSVAWYNLIPDQSHAVVTAGYGTATGNGTGNIQTDNYVTTASTADGSLVIAYCPASTTIAVNMGKLRGSTTARWFDPTNNTYQTIGGSPFSNSGSTNFVTPGSNSVGDPDWVLVLTSP